MTNRNKYIIAICILVAIIISVFIGYSIKSYIVHEKEEAINQKIMLSWFGYGDGYSLEASDENTNEINPIYVEPMERWENVGLLKIMEETGVWTKEACEDVDVFDEGTMEYDILHGGFSFDDVDYSKFDKAMINIDSALHKGTTDPRDMHDFWEEAALLEYTNTYD